MEFDNSYYPYPSRRSCVYGKSGIVACNNLIAAQAGISMFDKGGNAIDAALACAAALAVTSPASCGPGGDMFAIVYSPRYGLQGINASGYSPEKLTFDMIKLKSVDDRIPFHGWEPVTIPGAPAGWAALSEKYGQLDMNSVFRPAVNIARNGFAVPVGLDNHFSQFYKTFYEAKDSWAKGWYQEFAPSGFLAAPGDIIAMPHLADTLEDIANTKAKSMYTGRLAREIIKWAQKTGGYFTVNDLESYQPQWIDPVSINYRGYDVFEMPPNGQGLTTLLALNILKGFEFNGRNDAYTAHRQIEAIKLAFADAAQYVADSRYMDISIENFLTEQYTKQRRNLITESAAIPYPGKPDRGGTVYLCACDQYGNMVSLIQSLYRGHGSGVTPPGTGMCLQCRGANFSLKKGHPNQYMPRKQPYHTIIPSFLMKEGLPVGPFGVMGGFMQPQGHVQVLMNIIDFHLNPQAALDAPRWCWTKGKEVSFESNWDNNVISELKIKGHEITLTEPSVFYGRGQMIIKTQKGSFAAGTEPRADGGIAVYNGGFDAKSKIQY